MEDEQIYVIVIIVFIIGFIIYYKCYKTKKIKAYCINLDHIPENYSKIKKEWSDILDIERFSALGSATESHYKLYDIIQERGEFPVCIIEDDVYKCDYFFDYWNDIVNIQNLDCDYITLDPMYIDTNKRENDKFISLHKHNGAGFIIYNKSFFDKFNNIDKNGTIDLTITHNPKFIKYTPSQLIVRQYVDKISTTAFKNTKSYELDYDETENRLDML